MNIEWMYKCKKSHAGRSFLTDDLHTFGTQEGLETLVA